MEKDIDMATWLITPHLNEALRAISDTKLSERNIRRVKILGSCLDFTALGISAIVVRTLIYPQLDRTIDGAGEYIARFTLTYSLYRIVGGLSNKFIFEPYLRGLNSINKG